MTRQSQKGVICDHACSPGDDAVKICYDRETDSMIITLRDGPVRESDEVGPGVIADYGHDGSIVRFEILQASRMVEDAEHVQFAVSA